MQGRASGQGRAAAQHVDARQHCKAASGMLLMQMGMKQ